MIGVVNYGMGNIGSIVNILNRVTPHVSIINSPDEIKMVDRLILPGVGAFDNAMHKLMSGGWADMLSSHAEQGKPVLGICLGMQIMTESSEEGTMEGLGWIKGRAVAFDPNRMNGRHRIPHMGWNIAVVRKGNVLFDPAELEERFYFLHSYHVICDDEKDVLTTTEHGYPFISTFQKDNIIGVQFHPEKSHRFGLEFFRHFLEDF